jgi:beta-mannanase
MYEVFEAQSMERESEDVSKTYAEACALGYDRLLAALKE